MPKRPLTAEDLYAVQAVEDPQISPDGRYIAFVKVTMDKVQNRYNRNIWLATLGKGEPRVRQFTFGPKADTTPRWSPDGRTLAFVSARNGKAQIYLIGLEGGEARPLTSHPNGAGNPVWSPNGKQIAFHASLNVEEQHQEDAGESDPPPDTALEAKHRSEIKDEAEKQKSDPWVITRLPYRTGTQYLDDRYTQIYVVEVEGGTEATKPVRLTAGALDFGEMSWAKDGLSLLTVCSRTPEHDPWFNTAIVRVMVAKKRKAPRRLSKPGHDYYGVQASPDGRWLAAQRQVNTGSFGSRTQLVVMPNTGGEARDLTASFDRNVDSFCWSADSKTIYFQAGDHGNTGVYKVAARGGEVASVVGGRRMVQGFSVSDAGAVAFTATTPERPSDLYFVSGQAEQRLTDFNANLLSDVIIQPTEEVRFTAPDGRELQGWLIKPVGFKRGQTYPLAVNMHGGPHVMWGPSMVGMWIEWQFHAARGYGVFYCNPRGSEGYGEEFSTAIQNDWGDHVMHDILAGVDNVTAMGWVDAKRLALTGGSYAGYMAAWIVSHDHRFACAWAQRGLYSLLGFYGTSDVPQLIEREFEMRPFEDFEKAWRQSPLAYVQNVRTPLAIEHQDNDWRCPPSEAEQLYAALKRLKREVVFIRYPREGHEMSRSGEPKHRVDRLNRMVGWFDEYCALKRKRTGKRRSER